MSFVDISGIEVAGASSPAHFESGQEFAQNVPHVSLASLGATNDGLPATLDIPGLSRA